MGRLSKIKQARQERGRRISGGGESNKQKRPRLDETDENLDPNGSLDVSLPSKSEDEAVQEQRTLPQFDISFEYMDHNVTHNTILPKQSKDAEIQCNFTDFVNISDTSLRGRRLISVSSLVKTMEIATAHTGLCKKGPVRFKTHSKQGLATKMYFNCGCGEIFIVKTDDEHESLKANEAIAWGCQVSATGFNSAI